jgi:hypothetical protein
VVPVVPVICTVVASSAVVDSVVANDPDPDVCTPVVPVVPVICAVDANSAVVDSVVANDPEVYAPDVCIPVVACPVVAEHTCCPVEVMVLRI